MPPSLAIGDFSRATHLNIKALRYYHRIGLLEPAEIDPFTGHRRYTIDQIPIAQVIRRFRSTDAAPVTIEHRRLLATPAAAVRDVIDVRDANAWYQGALGELHALLAAQKITPTGPGGATYANDLFTHERGEATVFLPFDGGIRATGRVTGIVVPGVELAITVHRGAHSGEIDRAYGSLATYVTDHALAVEGPVREYYVVGPHETSDEEQWRTEIGWPIFDTGRPQFMSS